MILIVIKCICRAMITIFKPLVSYNISCIIKKRAKHTCDDSEWQARGSSCPLSLSVEHCLHSAVEG